MKRGLIDQVEFEVWAGNGGRGIVHFRREKYIRKGGPDGGDGGNGGSIYFWANPHMTTLLDYAGKTRFEAEYGDAGRGRNQHGKDADDMTLPVPVGTVVYQETVDGDWEKLFDLDTADEKALVAQGGAGGRGNTAFKSSTNTTPMESEAGRHGERKRLKLELKILADVGLVGLPNAGKSTLLSVMTAARPEIASYPFTTIQPNLGVLESAAVSGRNLVVADIPGLIEDAHKGKGLGIDFLRHIERCQVLAYVVAPTEVDLELPAKELAQSLVRQLEVVDNEVRSYGQGVDEKPRLVVINKIDLLNEQQRKALPKDWLQTSAATTEGIGELQSRLVDLYDSNNVAGLE
jgi:GTPase